MTNHWPMKCKIFLLQASQKVNVDVHARNDQHAIKFKASQHAAAHQQGISHQRINQEASQSNQVKQRTKASLPQRAPHDMKNKTNSMKNKGAAWQETEKAELENTKADIKENVARMLDNAGSQAN